MPYGVHECLRSHRGVDLTGKPRDLAFAYYQYRVDARGLSRVGKCMVSYRRGHLLTCHIGLHLHLLGII